MQTLLRIFTVLLTLTILIIVGCGDDNPASPNSCANIAGTYTGSYNNSCGGAGAGIVVVAQNGCDVSAAFQGEGTISGKIDGNSITFTLQFSSCGGSASGTAKIESNGAINGTYSGTAIGPGCCGVLSGSFTLIP